jgi:CheY-like chemotaxis protein
MPAQGFSPLWIGFPVPFQRRFAGCCISDNVQQQDVLSAPASADSLPQPLVVAVVEDLFFGIKIHEAAKRAGARMVFTKTPEAFWQKVAERPVLIVLDLNYRAMEPLGLLTRLNQGGQLSEIPTLGYLPHVQEDLRRAATEAGCQRVLPRSVFSSEVDALIRDAVHAVQADAGTVSDGTTVNS